MDTIKLNRLGIFVSTIEDLHNIEKMLDNVSSYDDLYIVSDKDIFYPKYANISLFCLQFIHTDIVFLNLNSYLKHRDLFDDKNIILAMTNQEFMNTSIDIKKNKLKKVIEL